MCNDINLKKERVRIMKTTTNTAEDINKFLTMAGETPKRWFNAPQRKLNSTIAYGRETFVEYLELREKVRELREEGAAEIAHAETQLRSVRKQAKAAIKLYRADALRTVNDAKEVVFLTKRAVSQRIEEGVTYLNEEWDIAQKEKEIDNLEWEIETAQNRIYMLQEELFGEDEEMLTEVITDEQVAGFQTVLDQGGKDNQDLIDKINSELTADAEDPHANGVEAYVFSELPEEEAADDESPETNGDS